MASLISLGAVEIGLRLLWVKRWTISAGLEHPHFHHRLKSSHTYRFDSSEFSVRIRTNRYGLRGPEPAMPKPAGRFRILVLGDSFTFGFPVQDEETFCSLLEARLRARGYAVEVVNAGVSSYSPTLHYISLRDAWLAFEPDLVMLWYDLGDLQDDYRYQKNLLYDADGRLSRCDPRYVHGRFDWWEWANNRSALAKYLYTKGVRTWEKIRILGLWGYVQAKLRGERAKVAIGRLRGQQAQANALEYERFLLVREFATEELVQPAWAISAKYLTMIRDLLAERDIPFLLGVYPYGMVVGPDQWATGRTFWGFEPGRTYSAAVALNVFEAFSKESGVPLLNTFPAFEAAAKTESLFYDWDGHCTPAGHRVLAEAAADNPQLVRALNDHVRAQHDR